MIQALHARLHITFYMKTLIHAITFSVAEVNKFIDQGSVDINKINILLNNSYLHVIQKMLCICILFNISMLCLYMYSLSETTKIPSHLEIAWRTPYRGMRVAYITILL